MTHRTERQQHRRRRRASWSDAVFKVANHWILSHLVLNADISVQSRTIRCSAEHRKSTLWNVWTAYCRTRATASEGSLARLNWPEVPFHNAARSSESKAEDRDDFTSHHDIFGFRRNSVEDISLSALMPVNILQNWHWSWRLCVVSFHNLMADSCDRQLI